MRRTYHFIVALVLVLIFLTGTSSAMSSACSCLGKMVQQHACCPEKQEKSPCSHHQKERSGIIKQTELKSSCMCVTAPDAKMLEGAKSKPFSPEELVLTEVLDNDPNQLFMVGSRQKPVWLRRLFYPDRSALYLDLRHLLI
jgi:hypothetical protein